MREIFEDAIELESPEARRSQIHQACGSDTVLLNKVESLLNSFESAARFIPDHQTIQPGHPLAEKPGTIVGSYRLLEQIGEGGFGTVFMAEQEEPLQRKVALKIIKAGMDTKQVIARFEAERQALALMDHPNIAKVHDAGATENGRPYFVMELVRGLPITQFCEEHQLTVKERIELFIPVCQAIQHAHQKGIIHRDIKPTNVLVTMNEGVPHLMVIDFGIAKAIDQRLTEKTLFTNFAHMIGTPAYMSPEQAEMSKQDVDTRTDVYSLGILLYELLTGTTPFPEERLKEVGYAEIQRIISGEEPLRPSTVLSRLNGRFKSVAANRKCEPSALMKLIKGDLDWIILRAIDKDRNRRYATPLELVADLQRHLTNEPVSAVAPSVLYRGMKFARRNRAAVMVGLAVMLGAFVSAWEAVQATRSRADAVQQAATADAALRFLQEDLFRRARFQPDVKLVDAMETALIQMGNRYRDQPLVEAAIKLTMGKGYRRLRAYGKAEEHLSRAVELYSNLLGSKHEKTLDAKLELSRLLLDVSKFEQAEALIREVLTLRMAWLGPQHEDTVEALVQAGYLYGFTARHEQADRALRQALDTALKAEVPNYEIVHDALGGLAWEATSTANVDALLELRRQAYEISSRHFGPDDPQTLVDAPQHAQDLRMSLHRYEDSARLVSDAYQRSVRVLGENNWTTLFCRLELAELDEIKGLQTIPELRELLDRATQTLGPEHWNTLYAQWRLGTDLINDRYFKQGVAALTDALERNQRVEGAETYLSRQLTRELVRGHTLQHQFDEAEKLHRELLTVERRVLSPDAPRIKHQNRLLANLLARQGKWAEAAQIFESLAAVPAEDDSAVGAGLLAARLADDPERLGRLGNRASAVIPATRNPLHAFEIAQALLLGLDRIPGINTTQALELSERARNLQTDPVRRTTLSALAAWRDKDLTTASEQAQGLVALSDGRKLILAECLLAMTRYQQGDSSRAFQSLATGRDWLDQVLRSGDLGEHWKWTAAALIASDLTSTAIPEQEPCPVVNEAYLTRARETWQPVQDLLDQADWAARWQKWEQALSGYRQALAHPRFSWNAATIRGIAPGEKLAVLLVLTGNTNEYVERFGEKALPAKEHYLLPGVPSGAMAQAAVESARRSLETVPGDQKSAETRHRWELTLGMAEYRNGNFTEALTHLHKARGAFNLNCSGTAAAFGAMAAHLSGLGEEATALLEEADRTYRQLMERNGDDLGPRWRDTAVHQIALQEAHSTQHNP